MILQPKKNHYLAITTVWFAVPSYMYPYVYIYIYVHTMLPPLAVDHWGHDLNSIRPLDHWTGYPLISHPGFINPGAGIESDENRIKSVVV